MAVQAEKLIEGLRSEGHAVTVVPTNPAFPPSLRRLARVSGVRTAINFFLFLRALLRALPDCDLVHHLSCSHLYFFLATLPTVLLSRWFHKPVIINYRGGEAERFLQRWSAVIGPTLRAGCVVVPSEFLQRIFTRFNIRSVVVPNIADLRRFTFRARRPLRPLCISTRNLDKLYNVQCTLEAFRMVQQVRPDAALGLAGDGAERPALERFVQERGLRHVTFFGAVDHQALPALYEQFDIFINASIADNFPGAILEAAACGLPVVSSNAGGIPDLVRDGKTGLLVPVNDARALADKVLFLLDHPELASALAHQAYAACLQYAWGTVYRQWLGIYQQLSGSAGATHPSTV